MAEWREWLRKTLLADRPHSARHNAAKQLAGLRTRCVHCGYDFSDRSFVMLPPFGVKGTPAVIAPLVCRRCGRSLLESSPVEGPAGRVIKQ